MQLRYQLQPGTNLYHLAARNWQQMQSETAKRIAVLEFRPVDHAFNYDFHDLARTPNR